MGRIVDETFEALVFDWDGTAAPDRHADASAIRQRVEALCAAGVHVFVVSGTHVGNVDGQLQARPSGPGRLHLCLNRGSEVFDVGASGPELEWRRTATDAEERALDRAAARAVECLRHRGIDARVVSQRLNRRKIDLIPEPAWADPPKARIDALLDAVTARLKRAELSGLADVVALAHGEATEAGLADPRITSDVKHVEIGLTDKSDSARWAAAWLAARGITGGLVLIGGDELGPLGGAVGSDSLMIVPELARAAIVSVGVEPGGVPGGVHHLDGGPARFAELLDAQLARRHERRVPGVDDDPDWVVELPAAPALERAAEALGTLGNGWAATRATREEDGPTSSPLFAVNGVYTDGAAARLLHGPVWTGLDHVPTRVRKDDRRLLDLRTGVLARFGPLRSLRFASATETRALGLRAEGAAATLDPGAPLRSPGDAVGYAAARRGDTHFASTGAEGHSGIAMAARDCVGGRGGRRTVERLAAWAADPRDQPSNDEVLLRLAELDTAGFDRLLAAHREAWASRWADADVTIEGNEEDQLAARFAVFHLLASAPETGEAAVGARGLTGDAYGGHVFWDADVFVLPALVAIRPAAARAMLEYRIRRLPAARAAAEAQGLAGARFPWESAADGTDVTPRSVRGLHGDVIAIQTGQHEEHIVADIAWAAHHYATWTDDAAFLAGAGRDLLLDTARYWASRVRCDADGRGHLYGVMGPDEYHEVVDDNTFTNVMARWNLRRAAELLTATAQRPAEEATAWRDLADTLVDGWDPSRGLYEQFAGYWSLEPLLVAEVARPPVAIDVLLGADRVAGSQLIKQADVLMAHHLVPGELVAGSLGPCLAFYEPRCAHGSSLSPAIHASLYARDGQPDRALELWRLAARLDLDDLTGTTAGGLHLATMGGVWQALAHGFLGLRVDDGALAVDPCLPGAWSALGLRLRVRGIRVRVRADHDTVAVTCDVPLLVRVGTRPPTRCDPPGQTFAIDRSTP